uniref:CAZy families GH5 protein n=1 Tax=uncultured Lactococcus sp. TaxID=167973 RepID=A0A060CJZ8_9LACT|nr:CAZy families GH5 protein [uncultured Lactococcus sp.]
MKFKNKEVKVKMDKIKGTNLGGWLVLEKWMTPHLFDNTNADDEYIYRKSYLQKSIKLELVNIALILLRKQIF